MDVLRKASPSLRLAEGAAFGWLLDSRSNAQGFNKRHSEIGMIDSLPVP